MSLSLSNYKQFDYYIIFQRGLINASAVFITWKNDSGYPMFEGVVREKGVADYELANCGEDCHVMAKVL